MMMMPDFPVVTVAEMKALEGEAFKLGLPYDQMMERAGLGVAEAIQKRFNTLAPRSILGLVGSGNNGGDSLIALARLAQAGWRATALLSATETTDSPLAQRLEEAGGTIVGWSKFPDKNALITNCLSQAGLILDGLLGTGTRLPLRGPVAEILSALRSQPALPPVVALDCPSGVDCDTGEADELTLPARLTLCVEAAKTGLLRFPAADLTGELQRVPLGLPAGSWLPGQPNTRLLTTAMAHFLLPPRASNAHKGTFGSALLIAGSRHYTGAALLATAAALRAGPGLVYAAIPLSLHAPLACAVPEAIWEVLPEVEGGIAAEAASLIPPILANKQALLLGPGLGQAPTTRAFLTALLTEILPRQATPIPMVLDADALRLLATLADWPAYLPASCLLTPHPGEMAALTGLSIQAVQADRVAIARKFARAWGQAVILKGAHTVLANPSGQVVVLPGATSALAHGGSGDVLAGMAVGLMAQGLDAWDAGRLAVYLHFQCAVLATQTVGHPASVLAGDLVKEIGKVFRDLQTTSPS